MVLLSIAQIRKLEKSIIGIAIVGATVWSIVHEIGHPMEWGVPFIALVFALQGSMSLVCGDAKVERTILKKGKKVKAQKIYKKTTIKGEEENFYRVLVSFKNEDQEIKSCSVELLDEKGVPKDDVLIYFYPEYPDYIVMDSHKQGALWGAILYIVFGCIIGAFFVFGF